MESIEIKETEDDINETTVIKKHRRKSNKNKKVKNMTIKQVSKELKRYNKKKMNVKDGGDGELGVTKVFSAISSVMSVIIVLVVIVVFAISYFGFGFSKDDEMKNVSDGSDFESMKYYGKVATFKHLISRIIIFHDLERNSINKNFAQNVKSDTRLNFLLCGPPGTGKTAFVKKFSFYLDYALRIYTIKKSSSNIPTSDQNLGNANFRHLVKKLPSMVKVVFVDPSGYLNKFQGESERLLKRYFSLSRFLGEGQYLIIFLDEIDGLGKSREGDGQDNHPSATSLKTLLLSLMDGSVDVKNRDRIIVIGATNYPDTLDKALLRRLNIKINFSKPSDEEIERLCKKLLADLAIENYILKKVVEKTKKMTQAQIVSIFNQFAILNLLSDDLKKDRTSLLLDFIDKSNDMKDNNYTDSNLVDDPYSIALENIIKVDGLISDGSGFEAGNNDL